MQSSNHWLSLRVASSLLSGLLLLPVFQTPSLAQAASQASKPIFATGEAAVENGNVDLARSRALKVAFRNAVEKGLGAFVSSQTTVSNLSEVKDKITSRADGYVLGYDLVREWQTGEILHVQIAAQVGLEQIKSDFASLTKRVASQLGNPAVAFILTTVEEGIYVSDLTIIDAFQEQFLNQGFDLKATDKARAAAVGNLRGDLAVNVVDRALAKEFGAKEGANYVARGTVEILEIRYDSSTGGYAGTTKIGVEVIDSSTGDVVASFADTVKTTAATEAEARAQAIRKNAIVAARTLSGQTVSKWQDRANNGQVFTLVIRGIKSARDQERPLKKALSSFCEVRHSQLDMANGRLTIDVLFKGAADELADQLFTSVEMIPSFKNFDKEAQTGNTIKFRM